MKRSLFILVLCSLLFIWFSELLGQSVFEDGSTSVTTLDAAPYASLSLDAVDYNPAGNVFLRNGFELSLSSLWPHWRLIENRNTFMVRDIEVERVCEDYSNYYKLSVPNPSARISYRHGNCALAFSFAHGENCFEGSGNTYFDEVTQKTMYSRIIEKLNELSDGYSKHNTMAYIVSMFDGVDVRPPYELGTEFPLTIMSLTSQYGCLSDRFSLGYTHRINVGNDEKWRYLSVYGGVKAQRLEVFSKTDIGLFYIEQNNGCVNPVSVLCKRFAGFYYQLADSVSSSMSDYYSSIGQSFDNMQQFVDTAFKDMGANYPPKKGWGLNGELGVNLVCSYWNLAAKVEFGCLPFKTSFGGSHYFGQWQFSVGIDVGYANESCRLYSKLFRQQSDGSVEEHWYGDVGIEAAYRIPSSYWTLKCGLACGINKDVLLNNGYEFFLAKHNTLSPSLGFQWKASSLLMLVGGVRVNYPIGKKEFDTEGSFDSGAVCKLKPDYQVSIGFVAHLE